MEKLDIYSKIAKADPAKEQMIVITVTDYIKSIKSEQGKSTNSTIDRQRQDPTGEKLLFGDREGLIYTDKIKNWLQPIKKWLEEQKNVFNLKQPYSDKINTDFGTVELYIEPVTDHPRLIIFGAGHIAQPLAKIANMVDFSVTVIDDRQELLTPNRFPEVKKMVCRSFEDYLHELEVRPDDYLVIVTRGHQHDYTVLKEVVESPAKYIGMIGSKRKIKITFDKLINEDNISQRVLDRVKAPVGIYIHSETPAEIAVSIMAEVISVRRAE